MVAVGIKKADTHSVVIIIHSVCSPWSGILPKNMFQCPKIVATLPPCVDIHEVQ